MRILPNVALAALLLGPTSLVPAFAATDAGCPPGMHRAEAGGVGSLNLNTRKADGEAGGVGSEALNTRKADGEAGGVGSEALNTRKAEGEAGGVGSVNLNTRKAESEAGGVGGQKQLSSLPCTQ